MPCPFALPFLKLPTYVCSLNSKVPYPSLQSPVIHALDLGEVSDLETVNVSQPGNKKNTKINKKLFIIFL